MLSAKCGMGLLALTLAMGCRSESAKSNVTRINMGQALVGLNAIGAWIAKEQHFFEKAGLDVNLSLVRGDTQGIQALLAGSLDLLIGGAVGAIGASTEGADVVSLATFGATMPYLLVTSPDIRSSKDLAGKRIGVSGTGLAASRAAVEIVLKNFKLDRRRDGIILLPAGSANERLVALTTGGIHATVLSVGQHPRVVSLEKQGKLRILADLTKLNLKWDHDYLMTTGRFRDAHTDVIERVMKAFVEAHAFILNPRNKAAVLASIATNLGYEQQEELTAEQIYAHVPATVVPKPYSSEEAVLTLVDLLKDEFPNLSKVNVKRLLDRSFLRKLDESGFVDSLYSRPPSPSKKPN